MNFIAFAIAIAIAFSFITKTRQANEYLSNHKTQSEMSSASDWIFDLMTHEILIKLTKRILEWRNFSAQN